MLTWPRQLALSRFHAATCGKARGFEPKKEPETVKTNRRHWKQFLTYDIESYTAAATSPRLVRASDTPADSVRLTDEQASSWVG